MLKYIAFILLLLCGGGVSGQVREPAMLWLKGYGGDRVNEVLNPVTKTTDGGFVIALSSNSAAGTGNLDSFCDQGGSRIIYMKYNADASVLEWTKCTGNGPFIFPRPDGTFVLGGTTSAVPSGWAYKYIVEDMAGTVITRKTYGGDSAGAMLDAMISCSDGGYFMLGQTTYTDSDVPVHYGSFMNPDLCVIKIDSAGTKQWSKVLGGSGSDNGIALIEAPGQGVYVIGGTGSYDYDCVGNHGGADVFVARLDKNGNKLWSHVYGGNDDDSYWGNATSDGAGGVLVVAGSQSTNGDVHNNHGGFDYWLLNVDSTGLLLWDNSFGGPNHEQAEAISRAPGGDIWISGHCGGKGGQVAEGYGYADVWVLHTDATGNLRSAKVLGGSNDDWGHMIYCISNELVICGGYYRKNDFEFSSLSRYNHFPGIDAFIGIFAPWTTSAPLNDPIKDILIFPNPATEMLKITCNQSYSYNIAIRNVLGQTIYSEQCNGPVQIDVSKWPKETYFISYYGSDGNTGTEKILIQ